MATAAAVIAAAPLTPPLTVADSQHPPAALRRAIHVLSTEATALSFATRLYETDAGAQDALLRALDYITTANEAGGKLVICGVGKSGLVGRKLEASMKSLGLGVSFLHAAEAVHGDLGDVRAVRSKLIAFFLLRFLSWFVSMLYYHRLLLCIVMFKTSPIFFLRSDKKRKWVLQRPQIKVSPNNPACIYLLPFLFSALCMHR